MQWAQRRKDEGLNCDPSRKNENKWSKINEANVCMSAQLCPTLCDPMDCSPPGFSVHGTFSGKNTGVGCHLLLQWTFQPKHQTYIACVSCIGRWAQMKLILIVIWKEIYNNWYFPLILRKADNKNLKFKPKHPLPYFLPLHYYVPTWKGALIPEGNKMLRRRGTLPVYSQGSIGYVNVKSPLTQALGVRKASCREWYLCPKLKLKFLQRGE